MPLWVVVGVILLSLSSIADTDSGVACSFGCEALNYNGDIHYCNFETGTCFRQEIAPPPSVNESLPPEPAGLTTEEKVAALEESIALLQNDVAAVTSGVSLINPNLETVKGQIAQLQADLTAIQNEISSQKNSLSTGLAGLQLTLDGVEENLTQRQSLNRLLTTLILVVLVAGVAAGIVYFVTRKQKNISPEIVQYITSHIRQGKKLPQIKESLRKAGWEEADIDWAYKETIKQNYKQFKGTVPETKKEAVAVKAAGEMPATRRAAPSLAYDPKKMVGVAVVSILLIVGILFVLRGVTTGKAIEFKKLVGGEIGGTAGEVTYAVECTPPHILNPIGDACCLDVDNSTICDLTEARQGQVTGGICNDNNQCPRGEYCVNSKCGTLASLYKGEGDCTKLCSYYAVKVVTSDGETYSIKPKQGSYTAAGALEWKVLEMPQHCKGEAPLAPFNIILKRPGEIVSEQVITLQQGEKSAVLTHPGLPKVAFTLTADTIFETCPR